MTKKAFGNVQVEFPEDKPKRRRPHKRRQQEPVDADAPADLAAAWRLAAIFMFLVLALMAWGFWA
jgi:hypothetical protein